jgi:predicted chitinase
VSGQAGFRLKKVQSHTLRNPKALAENVYFGRMGNDTKEKASLYIGRGFIQLTGYNNVRAFASEMRVPEVLNNPTLLEEEYAMDTAIMVFSTLTSCGKYATKVLATMLLKN